MVWVDKKGTVGFDKFPKVTSMVNNSLIGIVGDWEAEVSVMNGSRTVFRLRAANCQKDFGEISWNKGVAVMCAMIYGKVNAEKEPVFRVSAKFQVSQKENREMELGLILTTLREMVDEEIFPNARVAIDARSLLETTENREYMEKMNFPATIWSHNS